MSDVMTPIAFDKLCKWVETEYKEHGTIFGVSKFYKKEDDKSLSIFGERLETPFGPAAGPHTQLAQNIIAAYVAGCRFFELKTVQIIDGEDLSKLVAKPCILANDEGYNCEWSTELTVQDAFDEYVKAYFLCKLLAKQWGFGDPDGFVFNLSVGYDLEGIKSAKIDSFIENMKDASNTPIWKECQKAAIENLHIFTAWDEASIRSISPQVSRSITLSTLHGCPPEEIERIATYLITQKGMHTFVKCNPTLLGYQFARNTLDSMGYDYMVFDDHHFKADLQYEDAVPMFHRLIKLASDHGLSFGVKLTNTFPVKVTRKELPSEEMYMSGRSLFPLTCALAAKLAKEFNGKLRISFSGGADAYNICSLFQAGIWPITVATTLLKPGGYMRCVQLANRLGEHPYTPFMGVDVNAVEKLSVDITNNAHHIKPIKPLASRKLPKKVPLNDCFLAPCSGGCPIHQDIPEYVELVGKGKNREALRVILEKNPLPFITGTICPHNCTTKCTRNFYETSIRIREAKLTAAKNAFDMILGEINTPPKTKSMRVAVVGGGPAGISVAYFLGRAGVAVTLYEKRDSLGGIVRHVIPRFRIEDYAIDQDIQLMERMGVQVEYQEAPSLAELKNIGFDYIVYAVGAGRHDDIQLQGQKAVNANDFLEQYKKDEANMALGKHVVVIGGGNVAMDAARAAKRVQGVESVSIVYRRTRREMPADLEEYELAHQEGVQFLELLQPEKFENGTLTCEKMVLGQPDESGRRRPEKSGEMVTIPCDYAISATGEKVDADFFAAMGIDVSAKGYVVADENGKTNIDGVYVIGDALKGPATVVEAIADATRCAEAITSQKHEYDLGENCRVTSAEARAKKGILKLPKRVMGENKRCLNCNTVCENCVDVCPNRANLAIEVPGKKMTQILHVDIMCNECGNCETFCPYDSAPYKEKLTLFHTEKEFEESKNHGFMVLDPQQMKVRVRIDGNVMDTDLASSDLCRDTKAFIEAVIRDYSYIL